jgi:hypothetical protein
MSALAETVHRRLAFRVVREGTATWTLPASGPAKIGARIAVSAERKSV